MDDNNTNGHAAAPEDDSQPRNTPSEDEKKVSKFLQGRSGTRMFSYAALLEQMITAFIREHGQDSPALMASQTEAEKLKLVLATIDYVIAVESIDIVPSDKSELVRRAYAEIFSYGPFEPYLKDETITTIVVEGAEKFAVRRGHGELESIESQFEDHAHLRRIIRRMLIDAGTDIDVEPIMEVGLQAYDRPMSVSVALPPVTLQSSLDIRLHPKDPISVDDMIKQAVFSERDARLLRAIVQSSHGFIVVGDTEAGKTTLMNALLAQLDDVSIASVERTGEIRLEDVSKFVVQWHGAHTQAQSFGTQIHAALETNPDLLVLDEVRADEPASVVPLLSNDDVPRQAWVFRGPANTKRLIAALGMVVRRGAGAEGESLLQSLYRRLPFVILLRRSKGKLSLRGIAEWQFDAGSNYASLVELMTMGWDGLEFTGKRPVNRLELDDMFWDIG